MKRYITGLILIFISSSLYGQFTFSDEIEIFRHPRSGDIGLFQPFVPYDYNNDGVTDFFGNGGNSFVYKGVSPDSATQVLEVSGNNPIRSLDWDSDGDMDALFQSYVLLTLENDTFERLSFATSFAEVVRAVDYGDFNNDGLLDVVSLVRSSSNVDNVSIYYSTADGSFVSELVVEGSANSIEAAVAADINNDGIKDLIINTFGAHVYLNDGTGTFTKNENALSGGRYGFTVSDIDGDGDNDLIAVGGIPTIYLNNNGEIDVDSKLEIVESATAIKMADLNNDGLEDMILFALDFDMFRLKIMLNQGGTFGNAVLLKEIARPNVLSIPAAETLKNAFSVIDQNGDGKLDLIYTENIGGPNRVVYFENQTVLSTQIPPTNDIVAYPNPTHDLLNLKGGDGISNYEIYTAGGVVIKKGIMSGDSIDISYLNQGIYFLKLKEQQRTIRFVKY